MKKKETETIFPLPGFPSVSKQFTASGFVVNEKEYTDDNEAAAIKTMGAFRSLKIRLPKKGKR